MYLSILTIIVILAIAFSYKPKFESRVDFLNKENCVNLRGIMAILIILCHVLLEIPTKERGASILFLHCGYLCVSVFFFLSGYGLYVSQEKWGGYYLSIKYKLLFLSVLYVLSNVFFVIVCNLRGNDITLYEFIYHQPYLGTTWFLVMLGIMYIVFLLGIELKLGRQVLLLFVSFSILTITILLKLLGAHVMWYYSNLSFPVGIAVAMYYKQISTLLQKRWTFSIIACVLLFCILCFSEYFLYVGNDAVIELRNYSRMLSTVVFSLLICCMLFHLNASTGFWRFVGNYSLEIYLLHAPVYFILRSNVIYIDNSLLYVSFTIIVTIIISLPIKRMNDFIKQQINSISR